MGFRRKHRHHVRTLCRISCLPFFHLLWNIWKYRNQIIGREKGVPSVLKFLSLPRWGSVSYAQGFESQLKKIYIWTRRKLGNCGNRNNFIYYSSSVERLCYCYCSQFIALFFCNCFLFSVFCYISVKLNIVQLKTIITIKWLYFTTRMCS